MRLRRDRVARVALAHDHLVGALVGAGRGHGELVAHRPEAEQADAEFALQAGAPVGLQPPLDRVADVGGDVAEIGPPLGVARHAVAVVADREEMPAVLAAARDRDGARARVDAVLDQLGDRLERAALRQRDDGDRVPVVADLQPTARRRLRALLPLEIAHEPPSARGAVVRRLGRRSI